MTFFLPFIPLLSMKVLTTLIVALPVPVIARGVDYLRARRHYARQTTAANAAPPAISLFSTNPTAIPLASIIANQPTAPTLALTTTVSPGATPTNFPGPAIPDVANLNPANYPALDEVPPVDSPDVIQWIQEVNATGIVIPGFAPTNAGGCPTNTNVDPSINGTCWWTCGGCTAPYDITECPTPLTWGLTYDDGPAFYTTELLAYLSSQNLKATFFVVGSRCLESFRILQEEYVTGHQIAVHTWSHPYLTTLTNAQIIAELGWCKKIIKDVLGVTPKYMRPPYGDIDGRVRAISIAMGLIPVMWTRISPTATFDTGDFDIVSNTSTSFQVIENWENIMGNVTDLHTGFIVLEHDLFEQTIEIATGYILPDALAFRPTLAIQPVISCLNLPFSDAYIETNDNSSNPPLISGTSVTVIHPSATGSGGAR